MNKLQVVVIEGTDRPNRRSINVARLVNEVANSMDEIEATLVDPEELEFSYSGGDSKFDELVKNADAYVIVTPEYNHSFSGTLKTLLDTNLKEYIHKPVTLIGVSAGPWGGTRAVQSLVPVVRELGMVATFADAFFPSVQNLFDEEGNLLDEDQKPRIESALTELIWMAKTLKWGRENLESKHHQK